MERKLALWIAIPFLAIPWALIGIDLLAPGLIEGFLVSVLVAVLAVIGMILLIIQAVIEIRSGAPSFLALSSIAVVVIVTAVNLHKEIIVVSIVLLKTASMDSFERGEGMRFAAAADGRFHPRIVIDGGAVDFAVDTDEPDIVLTSEDAQRIGIDLSSLTFDQEVKIKDGKLKAAGVRLGRLQVGSIVIEDVPAKVLAGNASGNVLGMSFFDRLSEWEVRGDQLMIVQ